MASCEHECEPSSSTYNGEFVADLTKHWFKDSAQRIYFILLLVVLMVPPPLLHQMPITP